MPSFLIQPETQTIPSTLVSPSFDCSPLTPLSSLALLLQRNTPPRLDHPISYTALLCIYICHRHTLSLLLLFVNQSRQRVSINYNKLSTTHTPSTLHSLVSVNLSNDTFTTPTTTITTTYPPPQTKHSKCSPTVLPFSPPFSPSSASPMPLTPPQNTIDDTTHSPRVMNLLPEVLRRSLLEPTLVMPKPRGPSNVQSRREVLNSNVE